MAGIVPMGRRRSAGGHPPVGGHGLSAAAGPTDQLRLDRGRRQQRPPQRPPVDHRHHVVPDPGQPLRRTAEAQRRAGQRGLRRVERLQHRQVGPAPARRRPPGSARRVPPAWTASPPPAPAPAATGPASTTTSSGRSGEPGAPPTGRPGGTTGDAARARRPRARTAPRPAAGRSAPPPARPAPTPAARAAGPPRTPPTSTSRVALGAEQPDGHRAAVPVGAHHQAGPAEGQLRRAPAAPGAVALRRHGHRQRQGGGQAGAGARRRGGAALRRHRRRAGTAPRAASASSGRRRGGQPYGQLGRWRVRSAPARGPAQSETVVAVAGSASSRGTSRRPGLDPRRPATGAAGRWPAAGRRCAPPTRSPGPACRRRGGPARRAPAAPPARRAAGPASGPSRRTIRRTVPDERPAQVARPTSRGPQHPDRQQRAVRPGSRPSVSCR